MEKDSIEQAAGSSGLLSTGWFDPIETAIRDRVRGFIETLVAAELDEALGCGRYRRAKTDGVERRAGYRHGCRERQLLGSFGPVTISVPRARLNQADGTNREWHSEALPRLCADDEAGGGIDRRRVPCRAPTRAGCGGHWERCSRGRCRRTRSAEPGGRCRPTGRRGATARWLKKMLSG